MTVHSFNYASVHEWCRTVTDKQDLFSSDNTVYCPHPGKAEEIGAPDYLEAGDNIDDPSQTAEDYIFIKNRYLTTGDIFIAGLNNVKMIPQNLHVESYHLFLNQNIALAESCGNAFYSDWATRGETMHVPRRIMNLEKLGVPGNNDENIKVKLYADYESEKHFDEDVVIMTSLYSANFFHWMIEILPRFWFNDSFPEMQNMPLILPRAVYTPFWETFLDIAGKNRKYHVCEEKALTFKRAYLPSLSSGCSPRQIEFVNQFLSKAFNIQTPQERKKRLYISREDTIKRRVKNEDAVFEKLKPYGFEKVTLTNLSLKEQIELFRQVDIVVAPHGAGNTNMCFASEGATLIEFLPRSYRQRIFWMMTKFKHQNYGRMLIDVNDENETMEIDLDRLDALIQPALQS